MGEIIITNPEGTRNLITGYTPEDYSGITWLGDNRYAVVTDKKDGFYEFTFDIDSDGVISNLICSDFRGDTAATRDCEDIIYHPSRGKLFISGEADQEIMEYNLDGTKTGNKVNVPPLFKQIKGNYGFEALGYDPVSDLIWTTTESTLAIDGEQSSANNHIHNLLRIQSFNGTTLEPDKQYAYKMDLPEGKAETNSSAIGVTAIAAFTDGRLLVLEREFFIDKLTYGLGSWVKNKIYIVDPPSTKDVPGIDDLRSLEADVFMPKTLLWEKKTELSDESNPIANYEGMCLGPVLEDGSHTLILINDSQGGFLSILKEYLLVLKFEIK